MKLVLHVTAGPHRGREFTFGRHDTFLVGRVADAHLRLSHDDPCFSRRHFVLEVNPPRCRLMDFKSRNGTEVNGRRVDVAEIRDGDVIKAGHTVFRVSITGPAPEPAPARDEYPTGPGTWDWVPVEDKPAAIGGYEIGRVLGRGGMGVVYEARRIADGAPVALKTFVPVPGLSDRDVDLFLREARIIEQLRHPNVVRFREVGRDGEVVYLAMELLNGRDAGTLVKDRGPLPIRTAVRIACHMLAGLAHAHGQGIVHRDIKPSNLLLHSQDGKKLAKLADFGLARAYEKSRMCGATFQGEIGGTPTYMAPEQITHFHDVRPAADQYSAAATLYTLLTGRQTHDFPSGAVDCLLAISTEDPVPIRERRDAIPEGLAEAIHRALSREPADRFEGVSTFRHTLLPWA